MTEPQALPPLDRDVDTALDFVTYPIPNIPTLKAVMVAERKAVEEITHQIRQLTTPATALVDPQGKPVPQLGGDIKNKIKALIDALLERPILSQAYGLAPGADGVLTLAQFEPAGLKLAFITYQGLSFLMQHQVGQHMAMQLVNQVDAMLVLSLQAIQRHRNPLRVLEKTLKLKGTDPDTGVVLVGEPSWAGELRLAIADLLVTFLVTGGYAVCTLAPMEAHNKVAKDDDLPFMALTHAGERLFLHLRDQMALKLTLMARGRELVEAAPQTETKTTNVVLDDMERALTDPSADLHQA